jgi:phage terminase small subunit
MSPIPGPFSAYCCAYAHWQQAEEALQLSGELTIKTVEGHQRFDPLVRIASQAMADMHRIVLALLTPNARLRINVSSQPNGPR